MHAKASIIKSGGFMLAVVMLLAGGAFGAPLQFNYQGVLTDSSGNLVTSNNVDFRVSIYDAPVGGTLLHQEVFAGQDLSATPPGSNGVYNLAIGSTVAINPAILQHPDLYLQLEVDDQNSSPVGWETLSPRQHILSSVFSMGSMDARNNHFTVHAQPGHVGYTGLAGIQAAINDIPPGRTGYIELEPGVYASTMTLTIPPGKTVILTGLGAKIKPLAGNSVTVGGTLIIQGLKRLEAGPGVAWGAIEVYYPATLDVRDATIYCNGGSAIIGDSTILVRDSTLISSAPQGSMIAVLDSFAPPGVSTPTLLVKDSNILGGDIGIKLGGPPGPGDGPVRAVIRDNQIGDIFTADMAPLSVGIYVNALGYPAYIRGNVFEMVPTGNSIGIYFDDPDGDGLIGDAWVIDNQIGSWLGDIPIVGPDVGIDMGLSGRGVVADVQRNKIFGMNAGVWTNTTDTIVLAHNQIVDLASMGGPIHPVGAVAGSLQVDNYGTDGSAPAVAELGNTDIYGAAFLTGAGPGAPLMPNFVPPAQGMLGGIAPDGVVDNHN